MAYKRIRVKDPEGKTDKDGKVVEYVTYEVVDGQAEIVRRVFEMRSNGRSYRFVIACGTRLRIGLGRIWFWLSHWGFRFWARRNFGVVCCD